MSVAELLNTMSATEIRDWQIYDSLEPFGEERADLRMGILAALMINLRRTKPSDKVYKPRDFMPNFYEDGEKKQGDLVSRFKKFRRDYNK